MVDKIRTWQFSWVSWYPRFDPSTISRHQAGSPDLSPPGAEPKRAALGRELRGLGFQWSPEKFASDTNQNGFWQRMLTNFYNTYYIYIYTLTFFGGNSWV